MSRAADHYVATIERDPGHAMAQWRQWCDGGASVGPFQTRQWLAAWYATVGARPGVQPMVASIRRRGDERLMLALPLLLHRQGSLRRIEFADLGVTDYAAPLLGPDCHAQPQQVRAMYAALRRVLPPADLFRIEKCAAAIGDLANPLLHLPGTRASALYGNLVTIGEDFDGWRHGRDKAHRKELERSWRVFSRHAGAGFRLAADIDDASRLLQALESLQRDNIARKGWAYLLDQPGYRDFYRRLLLDGLADGSTVLSALTAEGETVAALFGIRRGDYYAMIRIGSAGDRWRHCSPGRLLIERTLAALHGDGVRRFDFTIGDYPYKKGFLPERLPLFELELPLSPMGLLFVAAGRLKHGLRQLARGRRHE